MIRMGSRLASALPRPAGGKEEGDPRHQRRLHRQRQSRPARPPRQAAWPLGFDRERYRGRNVVERCCNRLEQFRAVATRYDQRAVNYRAMVVVASLLIWLDG
jgi:transposase